MTDQVNTLYDHFITSNGVFTDTRKPIEGGLFFALSGPNFNGNKFAGEALKLGAKTAVIDDANYVRGERYLLVENALEALQELAHHHRTKFNCPVLALTGSNGKTTTKELIAAILRKKYTLIATIGNLNNHIGVPLTLLRITSKSELAVIEMGANHQREIQRLCEIAQPTHGLITNIGKAHIEGFGSQEGISKAKGELYDYLLKTNGVIFVNSNDLVLKEMVSNPDKAIYYPNLGDFSHCELVEANPFVKIKNESGNTIDTHLIGEYNYINAAAAICIGKHFDISMSHAEQAVSGYVPDMNRSQVVEKGSNTIILDAYNANPDSMTAALETLDRMEGKQKVVILGDMLELGEKQIEEHRILGERVALVKPDRAYFCGSLVKNSAEVVPGANYCATKEELVVYLQKDRIINSLILIKASRGMGLETLVEIF